MLVYLPVASHWRLGTELGSSRDQQILLMVELSLQTHVAPEPLGWWVLGPCLCIQEDLPVSYTQEGTMTRYLGAVVVYDN